MVNDLPPKDRDIAMVFQSYALYPHMTVAENLAFGLRLRNIAAAEIDQRVGKAAANAGAVEPCWIAARRSCPAASASGWRWAVRWCANRRCSCWTSRCPTSMPSCGCRCAWRSPGSIAQLGATMIYVTHDQIEAMTLGQRIVVLKDGEIQQIDTPMTLYERPDNLFVASFLGSPAMNTAAGRLHVRDGLELETADGALLRLVGVDVPSAWLERDLTIGLRPEHLFAAADPASIAIETTVEIVEPVGNEVFMTLGSGKLSLVARMPPEQLPAVGDGMALGLRADKVLFFDSASGERLHA